MGNASASFGRVSKPGSRFTARRRIQTGNPHAIARHNRHVGEVLYAFNQVQASFLQIFYTIIGTENYALARELWDSSSSDRRQRELLRSYVAHKVNRKSISNALLWALDGMDILSVLRNDAVHADIFWHYDQLLPGWLPKEAHMKRLQSTPFERTWQSLRGDLSAIANYVSDLNLSLWSDESWPLTKRPYLKLATRTLAQKAKAKAAKAQRTQSNPISS